MRFTGMMLAVLFVGSLFACASTPTVEPKPAPEAAVQETAADEPATAPAEAPAAEEETPVSGSGSQGE
jgi:hypothetical protein